MELILIIGTSLIALIVTWYFFFGTRQEKESFINMAESSVMSQAYTDSNSRFMKCVFVVMNEFPKIMHRIMEQSRISAESLYDLIQEDQNLRLNQTEHQKIKTLVSDGYTKLDVTLMFQLISHYSYIDPPTRGWKSSCPPLSSEITIGDDTQRLRLKRNDFLHKVPPELSEQECSDFFSEVKLICARVDRFLNCTEEESFTSRIETLNSQPFVATEELRNQYDKEKYFEEYFVTKIGNHEFRVFKAQSLKDLIKKINERCDHHDGSRSAIKLTFPDISNPEFTEIMSNLRGEINQDLVNVEIESINDGSLVMDIVVQTSVLLNDEGLKRELVTLLTRLLTIRECEEILNTLPVVAMVLSESLACFNDDQDELVEDEPTIYPKGSIQLNLRVNNNILQSEEILKSEVKSLVDTIVSHSNGNTVFPSAKPVVSVIEPGFSDSKKSSTATNLARIHSDKALNTTTKEPENQNREAQVKVESLNLQLVNRFDIGTLPLSYLRTQCCTLPNGLMVFTGDDGKTAFITKTDGTLQSTIEIQQKNSPFNDMTSTGGHCVAFSSFDSLVILIIDVIKKKIVKEIKSNHWPVSMTSKKGYILYCTRHGDIVKFDIDNGNERSDESDLLIQKHKDEDHFKDSGRKHYTLTHGNCPPVSAEEKSVYHDSSIDMYSTIASTNDRLCYSDSNNTVTVLDSKYKVIYKSEQLNMNLPEITIDHFGVVYVTCDDGKNISAIFRDGKTVIDLLDKRVLTKSSKSPWCVRYDKYTQQLLIFDLKTFLRYSINMS